MLPLPAIVVPAVFLYMTLFYIIAQLKRDYSVVDIAWGFGFVIVGGLSLIFSPEFTLRGAIVVGLVALWGARLGIHILQRNWGKPEDYRYKKMRENWGKNAPVLSFFRIFMVQGVLMLAISYPLILINYFPRPDLTALDVAGAVIFLSGFGFETISDYQLSQFIKYRKSEENRIMTDGLWRYSRHPNYFGEALLWWGIFFFALPVRFGWLAVFSPMVIDYLLLNVSGVPMLEERYKDVEEYQEYSAKTNKFFPWFPKNRN